MDINNINDNNNNSFKLANDVDSKKGLRHKTLIANIMKTFIPEYKDLDIKDIENCIEGAEEDKTFVESLNTEDNTVSDKKVIYDLLFNAHYPNNNDKEVGIKLNIEPQGKMNNGEPTISRAVYYASRLFSNQSIKGYSKLKEVYSIWICGSIKNTFVTSINHIQTNLLGNYFFKDKDYQKMHVIIIGLGVDTMNDKDAYARITNILKLVLNRNGLNTDTIRNKLENDYDIIYSKEDIDNMSWSEFMKEAIEKEGYDMVLNQGIELGIKQGLQQGLQQGIQEGTLNSTISNIKSIMSSLDISFEKATELLKIDEDLKQQISKVINN